MASLYFLEALHVSPAKELQPPPVMLKFECVNLQIVLTGGQVELSVTPSIYQQHMRKKSRTFGSNVNDNQWHSLGINYQSGYRN